jgi:nucleotidyltransferase substrate binding protein (TIGR01987 family)
LERDELKDSVASLESALDRLEEALAIPIDTQPIALDGTIQRFEFCYELVWKTMQRFARFVGFDPRSPRDAFRVAYKQGWIEDEDLWLSMLRDRNLTSHTYKIDLALEIYGRIKAYHPEMKRIAGVLKEQLGSG